ncbi:MAG: hypothetical protein HY064_03195 [Bacteroidetes bacterium]|nr:hypothetical protein [Bacteroidota bacterium]
MRFIFPLLISFFVLAATLYSSCENSEATSPSPDHNTLLLKHYLEDNFGDSIPQATHYFIMVCKKGSREQVAKKLDHINRLFIHIPRSEYSAFISTNMPVNDSVLPLCASQTDWDASIEKLELLYSSVTLIKTKNGRIVNKDDMLDQDENYWKNFMK